MKWHEFYIRKLNGSSWGKPYPRFEYVMCNIRQYGRVSTNKDFEVIPSDRWMNPIYKIVII